jgi:hypothetical protein
MICRRSPGRPSTACRALQSRPLAGFSSGYATLLGTAPPLNDASTAHGGEAASTFTLLPKQRGRKQTGCCQLLRLGSFLRGLETNLGSRSPVTGPCRNHASPHEVPLLPAPADCTATARRSNRAGRARRAADSARAVRALMRVDVVVQPVRLVDLGDGAVGCQLEEPGRAPGGIAWTRSPGVRQRESPAMHGIRGDRRRARDGQRLRERMLLAVGDGGRPNSRPARSGSSRTGGSQSTARPCPCGSTSQPCQRCRGGCLPAA